MNREQRRALARQDQKSNSMRAALEVINHEIGDFIQKIFVDAGIDNGMWYYKIDIVSFMYVIEVFNKENGQRVGKAYRLDEFMDMCSKKQIELELNATIRTMIDKGKEGNGKLPIWL